MTITFNEEARRGLTLGPGVRLHPQRQQLELKPINDAGYSTEQGLFARTRVIKPGGCRKWTGFQADVILPKGTSARYRLSAGTTECCWSDAAGAWNEAGPDEWNTEEEVASHIDAWPVQSLRVIVNLRTDSAQHTPGLRSVSLLYDTDAVALEDYVVRSFIATMRETMRPVSILAEKSTGQTEIDFGALQTPYDVVDVDAVYNKTLDPDRMAPLPGCAYAPDIKKLSIPAQPVGHLLEVGFSWRPEVLLTQSQDYTEIAKIPVILIDNVRVETKRRMPAQMRVINKATGAGFAFSEGYQADIRIPIIMFGASARDLHVMNEEASRFFAMTRMLRVRGQDEYYPITADSGFDDGRTVATQNEVYSASFEARIRNAVFFPEDARPITGVRRFQVDMTAQQSTFPKED